MKITNCIPMIALIALIGAWCPACGGGGGGGSTDTPADLPSDTGVGDDSGAGDAVTKDLIADAMARIAINAALKIGLGFTTDDELFNRQNVESVVYLGHCDELPGNCDLNWGETTVNCPSDCSCGDHVCDTSESAAACPADCGCGNGRCNINVGEDIVTCPQDCTPVCGDFTCAFEELFITPCVQDCGKYGYVMALDVMPVLQGMPVYNCMDVNRATYPETIYVNYDDPTDAATVHEVSGRGVCGYGYRNDDVVMQEVTTLFIDIEFGVTHVPLNGLTFTCTETMYNGDCLEGSAQLVFMPDGTIEFYTVLSGKVYAYREDPPEAHTIVGAISRGRITLPPAVAHQTCVGSWCPDYYRFGDVSVSYDLDGDGSNDYHVYYLNADDSIDSPDEEICQSFMVDWTRIMPDRGFGPGDPPIPAIFYDEDGNGLAACDDPACAEHPLCQMSYCANEGVGRDVNYHGYGEHPACPICGDGMCDVMETRDYYCEADCCGDGVCAFPETDTGNYDYGFYCVADCCGDGTCENGKENCVNCGVDCGVCAYEMDCSNGSDEDGDGMVDCADHDCDMYCNETSCGGVKTKCCSDGLDTDSDGLTDCADPECAGIGSCPP